MREAILSLLICSFLSVSATFSAYAYDSASFDPTVIQVSAQGGGSVPVGTIMAWPVAKNPDDWDKWLECNGQSISQSSYPELYAVVGSRMPDYQGMFLRGYGGNSSSLGVQQGDAIRNITGYWKSDVGGLAYRYEMGGAVGGSDYGYGDNGTGPWGEVMAFSFDASRTVPTANENRPINKAVRYLIRAKP